MNRILSFGVFVLALCIVSHAAESVMLSSCVDRKEWKFNNGGEFPGATGVISESSEGITLEYDFSRGGRYVSALYNKTLPSDILAFTLNLKSSAECSISIRVTDATGRTFQGRYTKLKKDVLTTEKYSLNGPWSGAWGGKNSKEPQLPLKSFTIIASQGEAKTGIINICGVHVEMTKSLEVKLTGRDDGLSVDGWSIKANWIKLAAGVTLKLTAVNKSGSDSVLSLTFPRAARNAVKRYNLKSDRKQYIFYYNPPLEKGGNRFNRYLIKMQLISSSGQSGSTNVVLSGDKSSEINFGKPVSSADIEKSPSGTNTHFCYSTAGTFAGWRKYEMLLDEISACGIKWIRGNCRIIKDKSGNFQLRPFDRQWMEYAASKKLNIILIVPFGYEQTNPELEKSVGALLRDTQGLVRVFELGNEPYNTSWVKKYTGTWNGYEKDGSISLWVKKHVERSNFLADFIKKTRPDSTVIGLGYCSPTNFHALNLGVSKNLSGVVDHSYTFSMPPEKIPYGHNLTKRDGIKIGDANHTFAGLIESYIEHFRKTGVPRTIWVTEFGFPTFWFNGKTERGLYAGFTEQAQGIYLLRRFLESLTLPIEVTCQYDFLDDYGSKEFEAEANFGLLRADYSRKPAFYMIQRMNSIFNGYEYDKKNPVVVEKDILHRSCGRSELIKSWDDASIKASNGIKAFAFSAGADRMLVVWSVLPYSNEFNNRTCTLRANGLAAYSGTPVVIDLATGLSFDVPVKVDGKDLVFENLILKHHPIAIKLIKK